MASGFLFNQLSDLKKDIMSDIKNTFPDDAKKFIKDEAKKLLKVAKADAKREVGTSQGKKKNWDKNKSYHSKWKTGRVYKYSDNDLCCRVYNSAKHGHLVEYGHVNVPRGTKRATTVKGRQEQLKTRKTSGYTDGAFILTFAEREFTSQWLNDAEQFMYDHFNGALSDGK